MKINKKGRKCKSTSRDRGKGVAASRCLSVVSDTMSWLLAGFIVSNGQNVLPLLHRLHLEQPLMQESMPAGTPIVEFDVIIGVHHSWQCICADGAIYDDLTLPLHDFPQLTFFGNRSSI